MIKQNGDNLNVDTLLSTGVGAAFCSGGQGR
jgi:hypothetical protein